MVASQDPPSVPTSLIELSSQIILHKFNSPAWLKHIQKANTALDSLTPEKMSHLGPGEAFIWSSKASDEGFTTSAMKIRCRPRVTTFQSFKFSSIEAEVFMMIFRSGQPSYEMLDSTSGHPHSLCLSRCHR
jgi:hypothetical protein